MSVKLEIRRTNRKKSVAFEVRAPDTMIVSAPRRLNRAVVERMAADRIDWAAARLAAIQRERERYGLPIRFVGGETLPYRGERIVLTSLVVPGCRRTAAKPADGRLIVTTGEAGDPELREMTSKAVLSWYKRQALTELERAVERWSPVVGAAPASISVRNQRRRWGSCSARRVLSFNWRLIMAPPAVLDYVVVHELCHLLEPNHSRAYWRLVEKALPGHAAGRRWLRDNAILLEACV